MLKTKSLSVFLTLSFLFLFALPAFGGIVECGNSPDDPCTIDDLIGLPTKVIKFFLDYIIPMFATFGFIWAGVIMMTSQGDPSKFNQGKTAMLAIVIGVVIIYLSWTLVTWFIEALGGESWIMEFFPKTPATP